MRHLRLLHAFPAMPRRVRHTMALLGAGATLAALPAPATAQAPYSAVAFFGDSFVDAGAFDLVVRDLSFGRIGFPPAPYVDGRFTNGAVWSEGLARRLGLADDARPRRLGGRNYAFGGATTGTTNVSFRDRRLQGPVDAARAAEGAGPANWDSLATVGGYGLQGQTRLFATLNPSGNTGTLAVIFAGGNDFVNDLDPDPRVTLGNAVRNMVGAAAQLRATGVRDFLVPSLPDLSRTPRAQALPPAQRSAFSQLIGAYNGLLDRTFTSFAAATGSNYMGLRLDTLFDDMLRVPGAYGITNTTTPCLFVASVPCETALFADDLHPSARAHAIVADAAYRRVVQGRDVQVVPEPATIVLVAGGLAGLGLVGHFGRTRRRAHA